MYGAIKEQKEHKMDLGFLNGQELSIGTLVTFLLYILKREGILRKIRITLKIGPNGNGNPGNPGNPKKLNGYERRRNDLALAIASLQTQCNDEKAAREKAEKYNREDHQLIFSKIEEVWKAFIK